MQINELQFRLERQGVSSRLLHLRVGAMDVNFALNQAAAKVRKKQDVPGFRKGKAPLKQVLAAHYKEVTGKCFNEIWNAAMRQVFKQLDAMDQPLIPPKLDGDEDKWPRAAYDQMLEFSVAYIVDPVKVADAMDPSKQTEEREQFSLQPSLPQHGAPRLAGPAGPPPEPQQGGVQTPQLPNTSGLNGD